MADNNEPSWQDVPSDAEPKPNAPAPKKAAPKGKKKMGPIAVALMKAAKDSGLSYAEVAAEMKKLGNLSPAEMETVVRSEKNAVVDGDFDKTRAAFAEEIAEVVSHLLRAANTRDYADMLAHTKTPALTLAIAQMVDKMNVLTGKPTDIIGTQGVTEEIYKKIKELTDLKKLLNQGVIPAPDNRESGAA